jgi:hypothetical protein
LRSRNALAALLTRKEWRALWSAPAWWVLLGAVGPLVGVSFGRAVSLFSEASAGAATGGGEAFAPLDGIWAPTFSAYEVAAVFLLPFVAIRLVGADRQSGALKIELQRRVPAMVRVGAKAVVLMGAWIVTGLAGLVAVALWASYGGNIYWPELSAVWIGHLLNGGLTIALAMSAASMTEHPSTAAIVALGVTVGTWVLAFAGIMEGGLWERLAGYTPTAMVALFQRGLIRLDVVLVAVALTAAGLGLAAIWLAPGRALAVRVRSALLVVIAAGGVISLAPFVHPSVDLAENRRNSFPESDEEALAALRGPISIDVHLAVQDPRRVDLEQRVLSKLRRVRPDTDIRYIARTTIGMWEQADDGYGEIGYAIAGHRVMSRATTAEAALEAIYEAAGVPPPADDETPYGGHPLQATPRAARALLIFGWPAAVMLSGFLKWRRTA